METTIPDPTSPPSPSTSFTSEEEEEEEDDCDDDAGKRRLDKKALDLAFDLAASRVASIAASSQKLADADALRLYGLYKQALEGDCSAASRPAIWDRKGRAKWDAWTAASGTGKEEAKRRYIELVESLFGKEGEEERSRELEEEGAGAGAGPGSSAAAVAARAKAKAAGCSTRFGPVFSVPGDYDKGDDRLVGQGIDDEDEDEVVMCPLSVAAAADDVEAIAELLSRGEDPRSRDLRKKKKEKKKKKKEEEEEEEEEAGAAAAAAKEAETSADESNNDKNTTTPLHWAADRGSLRAARALLAAGALADAGDGDGATPLHYACLCGRREVAELLFEHGADAEAADYAGERARDKAPRAWGRWPP